jgi:hypothetical protein
MKALLTLILTFGTLLAAVPPKALLGSWQLERRFELNGERHLERETLRFRPGTFQLTLRVDIAKGDLGVKGLTIRADGLWKLQGETLVLVLQQIVFAGVESTRGIDEASLTSLTRQLRSRYLDDPIRILHLLHTDGKTLTVESPEEGERSYRR